MEEKDLSRMWLKNCQIEVYIKIKYYWQNQVDLTRNSTLIFD